METKRCPYCHKLLRAEASSCSRCGHLFLVSKPRRNTVELTPTMPSLPPASPHRAGHYSGLHPEDQPYQSSMIAVQHPVQPPDTPEPEATIEEVHPSIVAEPQQLILPEVPPATARRTLRRTAPLSDPPQVRPPLQPQPQRDNGFRLPKRIVPILLVLSCIFFLLASSILAFIVLKRQPQVATVTLQASPATLRVGDNFSLTGRNFGADNTIRFTYDKGQAVLDESGHPLSAHSDANGTFVVYVTVPQTWSVGSHTIHALTQDMSVSTGITVQAPPPAPPQLQLSTAHIDLGAEQYQSTVTLQNKGGGQIVWQAQSDSSWLTATPLKGTFNGQQQVAVSVNHSGLNPQSYTGHLTFTTQNKAGSAELTVTMQINPSPASLNISTSALSFSTVQGQTPADQSITLYNSGGMALNWSSSVVTGDGNAWLVLTPSSDQLPPGQREVVLVSILSQQLTAGQYRGTVTITGGGSTAQVLISLTVLAPANLVVNPTKFTSSVIAGQNVSNGTLTLQNSGGVSLNWTASSNQQWLSATPASGTLGPLAQATVNIVFATATLKVGSYQGTLTISDGTQSEQIAVTLTVTPPPAPVISIPTTPLTFSTYVGSNPQAQTVTLTNTGNAPLPWVANESGNGASFAPVSPTSGTLAAGASVTLTVTPNVASSPAGTLTTTITIADSNAGTAVASQQVPVTITILDQANITVTPSQIALSNTASTPDSSTILQITNSGTQTLNWVATPQASAPWLSVDVSSGSLAPGASAIINVHANSSQLTAGTYTATLVISDSDPNTPVAPQTIQVTLTVQ